MGNSAHSILTSFILWKTTGKAVWNNLWFALPAIGYPLARLIKSKEKPARAENYISRINGGIWGSFGLFACSVALFTILYSLLGDSTLTAIVLGATLTAQIVLLFGIAETISGIVLKNWTIKIAGWITGIGGLAIFYIEAWPYFISPRQKPNNCSSSHLLGSFWQPQGLL